MLPPRERRWAIIGIVDGRSAHSWMGRASDPSEAEIAKAAETLKARGIAAYLAVTEGVYFSTEEMTAVPVRRLTDGADWASIWSAFLDERERSNHK